MTDWSKFARDKRGILHGYRSGLEAVLAKQIKAAAHSVRFEATKIEYTKPAKPSKYTPDFVLDNGIIIEGKGQFKTEDRQKHLLIQQQHPDLDIRFIFSRSKAPIRRGSKTTYAMWCDKNGFPYADKVIPQAWLDEPPK